MMTRHDFEAFAEVLRRFTADYPDHHLEAEWLVCEFTEVFAVSNPRFDEVRFRVACGVG
jgi:predicted ester cyclase